MNASSDKKEIHTGNDVRDGVLGSCVRSLSDTDSAPNRTDLDEEWSKDLVELESINSSHEQPHALYRDIDLNSVYDMENDDHVIFLDTYTQGSVEVFVLYGSKVFTLLKAKKRFSVPLEGCPTFVRSTCMSKFPRLCCGCIIAFSLRQGSSWTSYKLGIISALTYFVGGADKHEIDLYEHSGDIDEDGVPRLLKCNSWTSMAVHLSYREGLSLKNVKFFFLNQVRSAYVSRMIYDFQSTRL